jgi:hypothetical protein
MVVRCGFNSVAASTLFCLYGLTNSCSNYGCRTAEQYYMGHLALVPFLFSFLLERFLHKKHTYSAKS